MTDLTFPIDFSSSSAETVPDPGDLPDFNSSLAFPFNDTSFEYTDNIAQGWVEREFKLTTISNWPQTKTVMKTQCTSGPFRICTDVPVLYTRSCTRIAYVKIRFMDGFEKEIEACLKSSALAAAIAAIISGGAAGVASFQLALIRCLEAKGLQWANSVRVSGGWKSTCGKWQRR